MRGCSVSSRVCTPWDESKRARELQRVAPRASRAYPHATRMPPKKGKNDKAHKAAVAAVAAAAATTAASLNQRKPSSAGKSKSGRKSKKFVEVTGEGGASTDLQAAEVVAVVAEEEEEPIGALTMTSPRPTEAAAHDYMPATQSAPLTKTAPETTPAPTPVSTPTPETVPEVTPEMAPEEGDELQRLILSLGNECCFDCDEGLQEPWSSPTYGVLLCPRCAGEHPCAVAYVKWLQTSMKAAPHWSAYTTA